MIETNRSPDTLRRPEGNDLQTNYIPHDTASEYVVSTLEGWGLSIEEWGIDMREEDENLIFDDKMDMQIYDHDGELVGIIDVKSKRSNGWMGIFNYRHYMHYHEISRKFDVPVLVWMCKVDGDEVEYDYIIPIDIVRNTFKAPDGNRVIEVADWAKRDKDWLENTL